MLSTQTTAPDFSLPDQNGILHKLSDYKGKYVLLYFYPKDNTPGCTQEACAFRDTYAQLRKKNTIVIGISPDSIKSHKKFYEKFSLNYMLLADTDRDVMKKYEAVGKKSMFGRSYIGVFRISYLIDVHGVIIRSYDSVQPKIHAQQVLQDITHG